MGPFLKYLAASVCEPRPLASRRVDAFTKFQTLQSLKQAHKGEGLPSPYPLQTPIIYTQTTRGTLRAHRNDNRHTHTHTHTHTHNHKHPRLHTITTAHNTKPTDETRQTRGGGLTHTFPPTTPKHENVRTTLHHTFQRRPPRLQSRPVKKLKKSHPDRAQTPTI